MRNIWFLILLLAGLVLVGCSAVNATEESSTVEFVHLGNFDEETLNKMRLVAKAIDSQTKETDPYGDGCQNTELCVWDEGDIAFHIETNKESEFWTMWEFMYCTEENQDLMCDITAE